MYPLLLLHHKGIGGQGSCRLTIRAHNGLPQELSISLCCYPSGPQVSSSFYLILGPDTRVEFVRYQRQFNTVLQKHTCPRFPTLLSSVGLKH